MFGQLIGIKKVTPLGQYFLQFRSKLTRSADLEGCVNAISITVLRVRSVVDSLSLLPMDTMYAVTLDTSHVLEYLG